MCIHCSTKPHIHLLCRSQQCCCWCLEQTASSMVQNFRQIQSFIVGSSSFIITPTQVLGASSTALFAPLVTTQECSCDDVTDNAVAEGILDLLALSPHQMLLHLPCLQATIQGLAATSATDATSKVVNPPIPTAEGHNVVKTIDNFLKNSCHFRMYISNTNHNPFEKNQCHLAYAFLYSQMQ